VQAVTRPGARALILDTLSKISAADGVDRSEQELTAWLAREWA
jgi:hypothetical protein